MFRVISHNNICAADLVFEYSGETIQPLFMPAELQTSVTHTFDVACLVSVCLTGHPAIYLTHVSNHPGAEQVVKDIPGNSSIETKVTEVIAAGDDCAIVHGTAVVTDTASGGTENHKSVSGASHTSL